MFYIEGEKHEKQHYEWGGTWHRECEFLGVKGGTPENQNSSAKIKINEKSETMGSKETIVEVTGPSREKTRKAALSFFEEIQKFINDDNQYNWIPKNNQDSATKSFQSCMLGKEASLKLKEDIEQIIFSPNEKVDIKDSIDILKACEKRELSEWTDTELRAWGNFYTAIKSGAIKNVILKHSDIRDIRAILEKGIDLFEKFQNIIITVPIENEVSQGSVSIKVLDPLFPPFQRAAEMVKTFKGLLEKLPQLPQLPRSLPTFKEGSIGPRKPSPPSRPPPAPPSPPPPPQMKF